MTIPAMREKLTETAFFKKASAFTEELLHSPGYLLFVAATAVCGFAFRKEAVVIFILLVFVAMNLAFVKDISPCLMSGIIIAMIPMQYANKPLDDFFIIFYAAIYLVPAFLMRIFLFPLHVVKGRNLLPMFVYSCALVLGGLGSGLLPEHYFTFYPLYTVLGLGFLQIFLYVVFKNFLPDRPKKTVDYFCKMMCVVAVVAIAMIAVTYMEYYLKNKPSEFKFIHFAWKNYVSDILMLTMPFAFYLAVKRKYKLLYIAFGLLQYLAVFFTKSGGGILFSSIMIPVLFILTLIKMDKKSRKKVAVILGILVVGVILFLIVERNMLLALYKRKIDTGGSARMDLYRIALEVFAQYPIFGVGVGYVHPFMIQQGFIMTYFHSTVFQALGATGIVGLLAYMYMSLARIRTYLSKHTFNLFLLVGFLGYAGYSLVDVGTAMPLPFVAICTYMLVLCEKREEWSFVNALPVRSKIK